MDTHHKGQSAGKDAGAHVSWRMKVDERVNAIRVSRARNETGDCLPYGLCHGKTIGSEKLGASSFLLRTGLGPIQGRGALLPHTGDESGQQINNLSIRAFRAPKSTDSQERNRETENMSF